MIKNVIKNNMNHLNKWKQCGDSVNKRIMTRFLFNDLSFVDKIISDDDIDNFNKINPITLNKEVCMRTACLLGSKKIATSLYHGKFLIPDKNNDRLFEYICYSDNISWIKEIISTEMKDYQKRTIPCGINFKLVNDDIMFVLKRTFSDSYFV